MKKSDKITIHQMADALKPLLDCEKCNLLSRIPFGTNTRNANFIEKFGDELESMLGRRPVVRRPSYTPSGRGQFGLLKGGASASRTKLSVVWDVSIQRR